MTLAIEMAAASIDVCVLESGGVEDDAAAEDLNRGTTADAPGVSVPPFPEDRRRRMGGSAHCWNIAVPARPPRADHSSRADRPRGA
jgi:choline dehydrogenase-like flavoprotein